jgi:hypothetical protein
MESQILSLSEHEQLLAETLQKAVAVVNVIEERYREAALPTILQVLIKASETANITTLPTQAQNGNEPHASRSRLPSNISVNEFFYKAAPDSHPERFVCAAYYLLHTGKTEQFTVADIIEIYGKLREQKPKNPADVINKCIRKVHLIDAPNPNDGQKSWVITPNGEKYVEGLLNDNTTGNI